MSAEGRPADASTTQPDIDWTAFDTDAHRAAQAGCRHLIHCAVDASTRMAVVQALDYARQVSDVRAFPILIAQLTGPCCLAPRRHDPDAPGATSTRD